MGVRIGYAEFADIPMAHGKEVQQWPLVNFAEKMSPLAFRSATLTEEATVPGNPM